MSSIAIAYDTPTQFDTGPLTWVKPEVDLALDRGLEALSAFVSAPAETTHAERARSQVHQAAGALRMVGLDAVAVFTDEIEAALAALESLPDASRGEPAAAVDRACRRLKLYLDELVNGLPPQALKLAPEYEAMQTSRGVAQPNPADLFFPDLSIRPARASAGKPLEGEQLVALFLRARRLYQQGMLGWLRGAPDGLQQMRTAVHAVEASQNGPQQRVFWWTAAAFLDGLLGRGLEAGFSAKQLCARIDLQMRRFIEGSGKVADRLRREVLYHVAICRPVSKTVEEVHAAYRLAELIPPAPTAENDLMRVQPALREAREHIGQAKDAWQKLNGGRPDALPKLKGSLAALLAKARDIGRDDLTRLVGTLGVVLDTMPVDPVPDGLAIEYSTGMLLAESALENFSTLSPDFGRNVETMIVRLDSSGSGVESGAAPVLDEIARRAQERLVLSQVAKEILQNLRHIEQVLDAFFRDNRRRNDLATLGHYTKQILGALRILGLERAERLLILCQEQIDQYTNPAKAVSGEDLELLAESLSGLGFYIEAIEQQRPDQDRLIEPFLRRRLGVIEEFRREQDASLEASLESRLAALPPLVAKLAGPEAGSVRVELRQRVTAIRHDAELTANVALMEAAAAALALIDDSAPSGRSALAAVVARMASPSGQESAPGPSAEALRLVSVNKETLDSELLEIYLAEATEVLATIAEQYEQLQQTLADRELLRTIRRGFHTLKGSGRMVGLTELGELAWAVEKVQNRWLEEERDASPTILGLIDVARRSFNGWIAGLQTRGEIEIDAAELEAAVARVEAELGPEGPPGPGGGGPSGSRPPRETAGPSLRLVEPSDPVAEVSLVDPVPERGGDGVASALRRRGSGDARPPDDAVGTTETTPPAVTIGEITLSGTLHQILCDEAQQHLATLRSELEALQFDPSLLPSDAMVRASHTLKGIHRTSGLILVADMAAALERALLAIQEADTRLQVSTLASLAEAVEILSLLLARVRSAQDFDADEQRAAQSSAERLDALRGELVVGLAADAQEPAMSGANSEGQAAGPPEAVDAPPVAPEGAFGASTEAAKQTASVAASSTAVAPAGTQCAADDTLAHLRDDIDPDLLPIFLEEAQELLPAAGEQLRMWRKNPSDEAPVHGLRRTLHTFKGSARMAGAMRLGELTHLMESRLLESDTPVAPSSDLLEALDTDLDRITWLLDRVRDGDFEAQLPWVEGEVRSAAMRPPVPDAEDDGLPTSRVTGTPVEDVTAAAAPAASAVSPDSAAAPASAARTRSPAAAAALTAKAEAAVPAGRAAGAQAVAVPGRAAAVEPDADAGPYAEQEPRERAVLRVRADVVDRLVNEAGEVSIARARIEAELKALKSHLIELTGSVIRLRSQIREVEINAETQIQSRLTQVQESAGGFDPLEFDRFTRFQELTKSLAEGINDVSTIQQSLLRNLDDAEAALVAQGRLSRDVQQQLFSIRMMPFGSLSERLYRLVRQTAKELGKRANLEIQGARVELDRSVLEKLVGPVEHLLRNAIDHGLETREDRRRAGKPELGQIAISVRQQGNEVVIELADDGAGIDFDRLQERARGLGVSGADGTLTQARLIDMMFAAGFSTAREVTQISGRGIGLDVVRSDIAALGGRIEVTSESGRGTKFSLLLPLTLAVAQVAIVRIGGALFAIPAPMVEQVQQLKPEELIDVYLARRYAFQGQAYAFYYLGQLLGDAKRAPDADRYNAVLLVRSGANVAAVHVDEMVGNQEVVVKNIGPQLSRVVGVTGATVLGTGEVVLILNPIQLALRHEALAADELGPGKARAVPQAKPVVQATNVLVVDDSVTVRKITSRLLSREGFRVTTARDGVDALQQLAEELPDIILLDIEMPRMDGFELAKALRGDSRTAGIPIVMITSRTADKHRQRAKELGVEAYIGKPYQEEELLQTIGRLVSAAVPA